MMNDYIKDRVPRLNNATYESFVDGVLTTLSLLLGFFSTIALVRIAAISLYVWLMAITAVIIIVSCRFRLRITAFHLVWISAIITFALNQSALSEAWGQNNFNGLMAITLVALVADTLFAVPNRVEAFLKGVLAASKVQIVWIFVQFLLYRLLGIDINDLLFTNVFNMVETASQYKATGMVATGLCWNAGGIAAALLAQFALGDKGYWRILCIIACLLTQNSTVIIGLVIIMAFKVFLLFNRRRTFYISRSTLLVVGTILVTVAAMLVCVPAFSHAAETVFDTFLGRIQMLLGLSDYDSSFIAHQDYYLNLPFLVEEMTPLQFLFGYGIDCSGLPYTELTSQYWWMESWFVESDPMNSFLGMGLVGTLSIYLFLFGVVRKAWGSNRIASLLVVVFIICGVFYDVQSVLYYWLFMFEICLSRLQGCDMSSNSQAVSKSFRLMINGTRQC